MNKKVILSGVIGFIFGGAVGGFTAYKIINNHAEERINDEIQSVKQALNRKFGITSVTNDEETDDSTEKTVEGASVKESIMDYYKKKVGEEGYSSKNENDVIVKQITGDEFNENPDWGDPVTLFCYTDEIVADYSDNIIDDEGMKFYFGNLNVLKMLYDGDTDYLYFRNTAIPIDIEVLKDERSYAEDIMPNRPHSDAED